MAILAQSHQHSYGAEGLYFSAFIVGGGGGCGYGGGGVCVCIEGGREWVSPANPPSFAKLQLLVTAVYMYFVVA